MATLLWGIRTSLFLYIRGIARGEVTVFGGAELIDDEVAFPSAEEEGRSLVFRGAVTLTGHGGLLHITVADPVVHREDDGRWLISACGNDGERVPLADIDQLAEDESGLVHAGTTTLTAAGAQIFGGQYPPGSTLDSPLIRL